MHHHVGESVSVQVSTVDLHRKGTRVVGVSGERVFKNHRFELRPGCIVGGRVDARSGSVSRNHEFKPSIRNSVQVAKDRVLSPASRVGDGGHNVPSTALGSVVPVQEGRCANKGGFANVSMEYGVEYVCDL